MNAFWRTCVAVGAALVFNALGLVLLTTLSLNGPPKPAPPPPPETVEAPEVVALPAPEPEPEPQRTPRDEAREPAQLPTPTPSQLPRLSTLALDGAVEVAVDPTLGENLDALFADLSRNPTGPGGEGLFGTPQGGSGAPAQDAPREASDVDEPPQVRRRAAARYPLRAEREGVEGFVVVRGLVERDGSVSRVTVVDAQPQGFFEEAARSAFARWRFTPGRHQRAPVRVWVRTRLEFTLR